MRSAMRRRIELIPPAAGGAAVTAWWTPTGASPEMRAITWPTGTVSPAATTISSTPSAGASSSELTFSVSISTSGSPLRTACPACFNQRATVPSTRVSASLGSSTSTALFEQVGQRRAGQAPAGLARIQVEAQHDQGHPHFGAGGRQGTLGLDRRYSRTMPTIRPRKT